MVEIEHVHDHSHIDFVQFQHATTGQLFGKHVNRQQISKRVVEIENSISQNDYLTVHHPQINKHVLALKAKSKFYKQLISKGVKYRYMQKDHLALHYFSQAIELRPIHYEAYFEIGLTYHAMGNRSQAKYNFHRALQICQQEKKVTNFYRVNSFSNLDNYDDSVVQEDCIEYTESDIRKAKAYVHMLRGLLLQMEPNDQTFERALSEYQKALQIDSCQAFAHMSIGYLFDAMKDHQTALEHYMTAMDCGPDWSDCVLLSNIGWCHEQLGDLNESLNYYNRSVDSNPRFIMGLRNRARLYSLQEKYTESIEDYKRILELNPFLCYVYSDRGDMHYFGMDQSGHALNNYHTALLVNPKYYHPYIVLAAIHMLHDPHSTTTVDDESDPSGSSTTTTDKPQDVSSIHVTKLQGMTKEQAQEEAMHILNRGIRMCTDVDGLCQLYTLKSQLRTTQQPNSVVQLKLAEQDCRSSEFWPESSLYIRVKQTLQRSIDSHFCDIEILAS
jgi:tetratricopeptide (TPR) repeat protein